MTIFLLAVLVAVLVAVLDAVLDAVLAPTVLREGAREGVPVEVRRDGSPGGRAGPGVGFTGWVADGQLSTLLELVLWARYASPSSWARNDGGSSTGEDCMASLSGEG